jgi:DNA repair exonuclease SbcCD nuclease subunit
VERKIAMTKIMCLADLHLTEKKPQCRPDEEDWMDTVETKLNWISLTALRNSVDYIVIAGDIFDSVNKCSHEFMGFCIKWFHSLKNRYGIRVVAIPGNHDLVNADHSRIMQSPYGVLRAASVIESPDTYGMGDMPYGVSRYYGIEPIVLGHYGLWNKEKPYKGAPDEGNVEWFVTNCLPTSCKLFITGHYHVPFVVKVRDTVVVNCGCLFRMRADLINYKPYVTIVTVDDDYKVHPKKFPIPLKYEIRRDYIDNKNDTEAALDEMVGNIEGDFEAGFNFKDNFYSMSKDCENSKEINKEFERCNNGYYL